MYHSIEQNTSTPQEENSLTFQQFTCFNHPVLQHRDSTNLARPEFQLEDNGKERVGSFPSYQDITKGKENVPLNIENETKFLKDTRPSNFNDSGDLPRSFTPFKRSGSSSFSTINSFNENVEEQRPSLFSTNHPVSLFKKSEELKLHNNSVELELLRVETKEASSTRLPFNTKGNNGKSAEEVKQSIGNR